jgi:hypothetical protein
MYIESGCKSTNFQHSPNSPRIVKVPQMRVVYDVTRHRKLKYYVTTLLSFLSFYAIYPLNYM